MRHRDLIWWYWLFTALALGAHLAGWRIGLPAAAALTAIQGVHLGLRVRSWTALPVQVRVAALCVMLLGAWPPLTVLHWMQLGFMTARLVFGYCIAARVLSLLPWNHRSLVTLDRVREAFFGASPAACSLNPSLPR